MPERLSRLCTTRMPTYSYKNDGRIHTRFSELKMCTIGDPEKGKHGQIDRLVALMNGDIDPVQTNEMSFGTDRHEYFEEESKRTGKIPECFYEVAGLKDVTLDHVEKEYAVELAPGVVIHSRPDAVAGSIGTIFDYKTVKDGKDGWQSTVKKYVYPSNRQTTFYALMLKFHGIEITRAVYLCEIWDAEYEHILGYDSVERIITAEDLEEVHEWALQRILLLKVAINQAAETKAFEAA